MAFSVTQQVQILAYLGYPYRHLQESYSDEVEAIEYAGGVPEIQAAVEGVLEKLETLETAVESLVTQGLGLKSVDKGDFVLQDAKGSADPRMSSLYSLGKRYVTKLSILLEIPKHAEYFGTEGFKK